MTSGPVAAVRGAGSPESCGRLARRWPRHPISATTLQGMSSDDRLPTPQRRPLLRMRSLRRRIRFPPVRVEIGRKRNQKTVPSASNAQPENVATAMADWGRARSADSSIETGSTSATIATVAMNSRLGMSALDLAFCGFLDPGEQSRSRSVDVVRRNANRRDHHGRGFPQETATPFNMALQGANLRNDSDRESSVGPCGFSVLLTTDGGSPPLAR